MFSDVVMIMVVGVRVAVLVTLLVTSLAHTGLLVSVAVLGLPPVVMEAVLLVLVFASLHQRLLKPVNTPLS